jgi:hypothetical protein
MNIKFLLFTTCICLLSGCATRGIQNPTGTEVIDVMPVFLNGDARLNCYTSCSGSWGASRKTAKGLYEQKLWKDLAIEVARVGHRSDQTYFYFGQAAEGLGNIDAARIYYKLGLVSTKCDNVFNNCDGFVFPKDILDAMNRLPAPIKEELSIPNSKTESPPVRLDTSPEPLKTEAKAPSESKDRPSPIGEIAQTSNQDSKKSPEVANQGKKNSANLEENFSNSSQQSSPNQLNDERRTALVSKIKIEYDEFKKLTTFETDPFNTGLSVVFLRAWKPDASVAMFQIYVMDLDPGNWRYYHSTWDSDGNKLHTNQIDRDIGECIRSRSCSHTEHLGIDVSGNYLSKHRETGIRLKLSGKTGERVISIPAEQIDAFLTVVK